MLRKDCPPELGVPVVAHDALVVNPEHLRIIEDISHNIAQSPDTQLSTDETVFSRAWHHGQMRYLGELGGGILSLTRMDVNYWTRERLTLENFVDDATMCKVVRWEASRSTRALNGARIRNTCWNEGDFYVAWGEPRGFCRVKAADLDAVASNLSAPNELKRYALEIGQHVTNRRVKDLLPEFEQSLIKWSERPHRNGGLIGKLGRKVLSI